MDKKNNLLISIVIPTYNEEKDIFDCIESLLEQSYKNFEIIIVDDGSTDDTVKIIKRLKKQDKRINLIQGEHKGPGFSRNLGANKAKGEILVFVDSDMTFDKGYLDNLIKPIIQDKNLIGTTHELEVVKNIENIWSRCWGNIRLDFRDKKEEGVLFRAIRRDKFLEFGGFNPRYGYADDQTFWIERKIKPKVAKETICYHKNPETLKEVYRQSKWIGASIDISGIKKGVPFLMILGFPLIIPFLSIKRCHRNKDFKIILPMIIFIFARYFGTIQGMFNKIFLGRNVR